MESLLPAPAGASPPTRVPFVEGYEFLHGRGEFERIETCVQHHGTDSVVNHGDVRSLRALDRASCIQAWLFFGLLSTFFQRQVPYDWLVRRDETQEFAAIVVADCDTISGLIESWSKNLDHFSPMERSNAINHQVELLNFAADQCDIFDEMRYLDEKLDRPLDVQILARVLLSVRLAIAYLRSSTEVVAQKSRIGDTVAKALRLVDYSQTEREWGKVFEPIPSGGQVPLSAFPLLDLFHLNRWCPIRARRICEQYDYTIVNYLSRVPRLDPEDVSHRLCEGKTRCKAYDFDEARQATYKPKHTQPGCTCEHLGPALDKLASIIAKGEIPLISIDPLAENLDLKIDKYDGNRPYVAISHVWSDGLGNPSSNSLPICQLRRLTQILTNLKERTWRYLYWEEKFYTGGTFKWMRKMNRRVYFWMDTLCIPVQVPAGSSHTVKDLKRKAIRHITPIFEAADQVLVLDSELEQLSLQSPDDDEMTPDQVAQDEEALTARILGCKWLQRAWTLEEGSLASSCQFKVADGTTTIDLGELVPADEVSKHYMRERRRKGYWKKKRKAQAKIARKQSEVDLESGQKQLSYVSEQPAHTEATPHFESPLKLLLAGSLNENRKRAMRHGLSGKHAKKFLRSRGLQFIEAWNELLYRSATKSNDSLIIMANILDFNSASIALIKPAENRLPTVIRSSLEVPLGLLFNSNSRSCTRQIPQDSWMPTAIEGDRLTGSAILRREKTDECFRLDLSTCNRSLRAFIIRPKVEFDQHCVQVVVPSSTGDAEQYIIERCTTMEEKGSSAWTQQLRASYAETNKDSCVLLIDFTAGSSSINGYAARGAFLGVLGPEGKHMRARYAAAVTVWTCEQWLERPRVSQPLQQRLYCEPLDRSTVIELDHDTRDNLAPQKQRKLLKPRAHNLKTKIGWSMYFASILVGSLVVQLAYPECTYSLEFSDDNSEAILEASCQKYRGFSELALFFLFTFLGFWGWKKVRHHRYKKWLRTFTGE